MGPHIHPNTEHKVSPSAKKNIFFPFSTHAPLGNMTRKTGTIHKGNVVRHILLIPRFDQIFRQKSIFGIMLNKNAQMGFNKFFIKLLRKLMAN